MIVVDQVAKDLRSGQERHAELLDFEAAGNVPERGGLVVVGSAGDAQTDDREDHVARTGDVVDLAGCGWAPTRLGPRRAPGHAVAIERDQHRFEPSDSTSPRPTARASSGTRSSSRSRAGPRDDWESCSEPRDNGYSRSIGSGQPAP